LTTAASEGFALLAGLWRRRPFSQHVAWNGIGQAGFPSRHLRWHLTKRLLGFLHDRHGPVFCAIPHLSEPVLHLGHWRDLVDQVIEQCDRRVRSQDLARLPTAATFISAFGGPDSPKRSVVQTIGFRQGEFPMAKPHLALSRQTPKIGRGRSTLSPKVSKKRMQVAWRHRFFWRATYGLQRKGVTASGAQVDRALPKTV
jgi:hypothetical protein